MRILFFYFAMVCSLFSENNFKETRYLDAFGIEQYKYGSMNLDKEILTVSYIKPKIESIIYLQDKVVISKKEDTREYFFEEYPQLKYMGIFLKAIIENDNASLETVFTIKQVKNTTLFRSKLSLSNKIKKIEVERESSKIKKIMFEMTNKDIITIETLN